MREYEMLIGAMLDLSLIGGRYDPLLHAGDLGRLP